MGRSRNAAAGLGDNHEPLTDDDISALQHFYARRIRSKLAEVEEARSVMKSKQTAVSNDFALVKGQLQISRKDFERMLDLADMTAAEFVIAEQARTRRLSLFGLPVGAQLDMFNSGDTVDDMARAEADGRRAFNRGDDGIPPSHVSPVCHQAWMKGYSEELTVSAQKMGRAEAIIARIEEAKAAGNAEANDDVSADEEVEDEVDIDAEARRLKRSGFMERTEAEAERELADA